MIKLIGVVLVIFSSTLIGIEMSKTLQRRVDTIEGFISSLQYMENVIDFTLLPINEIINNLSEEANGVTSDFFKEMSRMSQDASTSLPDIWCKCLTRVRYLSKGDKGALKELGTHLGTSGKDAQISTIRLCKNRLNTLLEQAQKEQQKNGKMLKGLGFFGGLLIATTLI